jgi:hypothetical protein
VNAVPPWRIAAGIAVLLALLLFAIVLTPIYFHNMELQSFVATLTQSGSGQTTSDIGLRDRILGKAHSLNLPVTADDVHIRHVPDGLRIEVRYFVTVNLPGYTVNLHFYPRAGSR